MQCPSDVSTLHDGYFSDMIEDIVEVFMDDFSVYGSSFDACLINLERVLKKM